MNVLVADGQRLAVGREEDGAEVAELLSQAAGVFPRRRIPQANLIGGGRIQLVRRRGQRFPVGREADEIRAPWWPS